MVLLLGRSDDLSIHATERYLANCGWRSVSLTPERLVDDTEPNDSIGPGPEVELHWRCGNIDIVSSDVAGVLNLMTLPLSLFQSRWEKEDAEYACAEWNAYLAFALNQLPNVINRPSGQGFGGRFRSLPFQWNAAKRIGSEIGVPRYWLGTWRQVQQWTARLPNVVVNTNPFAHEWWMPGSPQALSGNEPVLAYLRPTGTPIVVTVIDSRVVASNVDGFGARSQIPPVVDHLMNELSRVFDARLMQVILFFSKISKMWTFGAATANFCLGGIRAPERPTVIQRLVDALTAEP